MSVIKHGDGTLGFTIAPEGDGIYELTGKFENIKPDETKKGDSKDGRLLELRNIEDPDIAVMQYIDLNNEKSLRPLMDILYYSGYCDKMHKKEPKKYPDPTNGWEDTMIRHEMFRKDLMIHGAGCRIGIKIVHTKADDKTYANIRKVWSIDSQPSKPSKPNNDNKGEWNRE